MVSGCRRRVRGIGRGELLVMLLVLQIMIPVVLLPVGVHGDEAK